MHSQSPTTYVPLYRSKDWKLAAVLYASGHTLDSTEWQNGICFFLFEDSEACERTILDFYRDELKLSTKDIFDAIGTVKNILRGRY